MLQCIECCSAPVDCDISNESVPKIIQSRYCYDAATCQTQVAVYMLGLGLGLVLFSALLGPARTRSPMFDTLLRRNNSHGHDYKR